LNSKRRPDFARRSRTPVSGLTVLGPSPLPFAGVLVDTADPGRRPKQASRWPLAGCRPLRPPPRTGRETLRRVSGGARARLGRAGRGEGGRPAMGHRVVSAQQYPRIPLIARQLRSRRFPGPGLRALVARASNPPASAKHRGIGAAAPLSEVVRSSSFSWEGLRRCLQRHCPS
jgi:hypothetical protein